MARVLRSAVKRFSASLLVCRLFSLFCLLTGVVLMSFIGKRSADPVLPRAR
jgi:hypothetical protein